MKLHEKLDMMTYSKDNSWNRSFCLLVDHRKHIRHLSFTGSTVEKSWAGQNDTVGGSDGWAGYEDWHAKGEPSVVFLSEQLKRCIKFYKVITVWAYHSNSRTGEHLVRRNGSVESDVCEGVNDGA